jgi:hypothetical protein
MGWIKSQYQKAFFPIIILACLFSFAPWMTGPVWFDIFGIILVSYIYITLWLIARVLWTTASKKINQNRD